MADLVYFTTTSIDGYSADEDGDFGWAAPDAEVHRFVNDLQREVGTYLLGRRDYEVMTFWETFGTDEGEPFPVDDAGMVDAADDYAGIWRATDKVVYSTTLDAATTARTRLERSFDVDAVRTLKDASDRPLGIGGPTLAGQALAAGLVDEVQFLVAPALVGGGLRSWPAGVRADLRLVEERRFAIGSVFLRYRTGV
jgi:dihydrofolate reductase